MHAYLITGNKVSAQTEVQERIKKLGAKRLDFVVQKIADVRELGKFTKLKLNEKTAIVISNIDEVGGEAQNSFLKALEEPQTNLVYILTAKNIENILPTIVSRCEVVEIPNSKLQITNEIQIQNFLNSKTGNRLKIILKINKREEAVEFINNILVVGHNQISNENAQMLGEALKTLKNLKANGNVQLQLTNFVVNIEK